MAQGKHSKQNDWDITKIESTAMKNCDVENSWGLRIKKGRRGSANLRRGKVEIEKGEKEIRYCTVENHNYSRK